MGIPIFCPNQKEKNQVHCLGDFRNVNNQLKRKSYTMPKINYVLLIL